MSFDKKAMLVGKLPGIVRRPLMAFYYRREASGRGDPELGQLSAIVPDGATCVDIGAHIGIYSAALSQYASAVHAFEPNPLLAGFLESQSFPNVTVHRIALGREVGTSTLRIPVGGGGLGSLRADFSDDVVRELRVTTGRLDQFDLGKVDFIKIDVEGFEEHALDGARSVIERDQPRLLIEIEERHNKGAISRIEKSLGQIGYSGYFLSEGQWRSIAEFQLDYHQDLSLLSSHVDDSSRRYINNFLFMPAGMQPNTVV